MVEKYLYEKLEQTYGIYGKTIPLPFTVLALKLPMKDLNICLQIEFASNVI